MTLTFATVSKVSDIENEWWSMGNKLFKVFLLIQQIFVGNIQKNLSKYMWTSFKDCIRMALVFTDFYQLIPLSSKWLCTFYNVVSMGKKISKYQCHPYTILKCLNVVRMSIFN